MTLLLPIPALILGALPAPGAGAPADANPWLALLALPGAPVALSLAAVGIGILLWLAGAKIVRPVGAVVGSILGIILGSGAIAGILSERFDLPGATILSLLLGGLIGAAVGLVAYRLICAGLTGLSVAALVLLATVCTLSPSQPAHSESPIARITAISFPNPLAPTARDADSDRSLAQQSESALNDSVLRHIVPQSGLDRWDALAPSQRAGISLVAIAAGLLAAFAGLVAPMKASAFSASILGSGLALAGIAFLTQRTAIDAGLSPTPWLIAWGLLSILGLAVQAGASKPEPKPA